MSRVDDLVIFASAARTTNQTSADIVNDGYEGIEICLDLTAFTTAASLTLAYQEWIAGKGYVQLVVGTALTAVGQSFIRVFPGMPDTANTARNTFAPKQWRIVVVHGNGNSHTYSATAKLLYRGW